MSRMRLIAVLVVVALVAVFAAGCTSTTEPPTAEQPSTGAGATQPAGEPSGMIEGSWNCIEFKVNDTPITVPAEAPITAEFSADGKLSGNAGVNTYNTTYKADGGGITIAGEIATTQMAGPEDAMQRETDYLTVLPTAVSYQIDSKSGQLVLFGPADNTIARYTPAD